jgi:hypothetical protein
MVKKSDVTCDELRDFLLGLGFREIPDKAGLRFEHPSGSILLYRLYKPTEKINARDIHATGGQLIDHGLVDPSEFARFEQQKTPA